jgi:hypothetical protein
MNRRYLYRTDSLWTPVARYFASLPEVFSEARRSTAISVRVTRRWTCSSHRADHPRSAHAEQRRKVPAQVLNALDPRYLISIRNGTGLYVGGTAGWWPWIGGQQFFDFR